MPRQIGPYVVERVLGEGGMGLVYRARDGRDGTWCAVKTVRRVDAKLLWALRREIRALGRLHHPGIVGVLDEGVVDGQPWYAMELLEGTTLAEVYTSSWQEAAQASMTTGSRDAPTLAHPGGGDADPGLVSGSREGALGGGTQPGADGRPAAGGGRLEELLSTLRRLCAPLAYLHGEGMVHGDLKPSNVFLRPDASPVIGDLGLASHAAGAHGRDVLDVLGGARGSVHYMAPEQVRGEPLDARADLYALGCMLYEAVTGRPPFIGPSSAVLAAHLSEAPPPPSELVSGLPEELEGLILRLLTKQPRQRPGFADDVAKKLAPLCASRDEPADLPRSRPYVYRSRLAGRDPDLEWLRLRLAEAERGRGGCVFLGGESGIGKTRLAAELGTQAARAGVEVLTGQCPEVSPGSAGGAPLEVLSPLLRAVADRCRAQGPGETARLLGERGPLLAPYEPSLADVPVPAAPPELARLEPEAARRRLFDALLETLKSLAVERSLLLILDDLQWCDELTRAFLSFVRGRLAGSRILLLGTYRTEGLAGELRDLVQAPDRGEHRVLERLGETSVESMVTDMLAMDEPPDRFVRFLARESEGNPFFVAEYLRTAVAEGVLYRNELGRWRLASLYSLSDDVYESLAVPTSLRELVRLRLGGLSPEARRAAQMASAFGREFPVPLLESALALSAEQAIDAVQELLVHQVLEHAPEGQLRFQHHRLRQFSYDGVAEPERGDLHRRAALAIESAYSSPTLAQQAELGLHWSRAGEPGRSAHHYGLAAEKAAEIYANAQAIDYYRLARAELERARPAGEAGDDAAVAAALDEGLGDVLSLTGRQEQARDAYAAALLRLGSGERRRVAALHRKIGRTWETHHEHGNALASYDRAAEELGSSPSEPAEAWWESSIELRLDRAWIHYWQGASELMGAELDAVRPHLALRGSPRIRARFFELMANLGYRQERYLLSEATVEYARKAHQASVETGDPLGMAESLFELGFAELFHGDVASATSTLKRAWDDARRIGDVTRQARSLTYLTLCFRRARQVDLVDSYGRRSLETAQESGIRVYVGTSQANLGWLDFHARRYAEAKERCQSALEVWQGIDAAFPFFWMAGFPLLAMSVGQGDLAEAVRLAGSLLAPSQQCLPEALSAPLREAVRAGAGQEARGRTALTQALMMAEETGYL